jgi:hypothetical protein
MLLHRGVVKSRRTRVARAAGGFRRKKKRPACAGLHCGGRQAPQADPGRRCRRGCEAAVTALARKLATVIWHRLRNHEPYRSAPVPRTFAKLRSVKPTTPRIPQESSHIHVFSGPCGGTGRARGHPLPAMPVSPIRGERKLGTPRPGPPPRAEGTAIPVAERRGGGETQAAAARGVRPGAARRVGF